MLEEFLEYLSSKKKRTKNTVEAYRRDLTAMLLYMESNKIYTADKITATNVNSYILFMEGSGKSPASISRAVSSMKTFFHFLLSRGYIDSEPTEMITAPQPVKKPAERTPKDVVARLLQQLEGNDPLTLRDMAMLKLLCGTDLRVGEIINITVKDVNLTMGYVTCSNAKGGRTVALDKEVRNALYGYIKNAREALAKPDCDYLFVNCRGGQLSRQGFWKILKDYGKKAGIEDGLSPETLRKKKDY